MTAIYRSELDAYEGITMVHGEPQGKRFFSGGDRVANILGRSFSLKNYGTLPEGSDAIVFYDSSSGTVRGIGYITP